MDAISLLTADHHIEEVEGDTFKTARQVFSSELPDLGERMAAGKEAAKHQLGVPA